MGPKATFASAEPDAKAEGKEGIVGVGKEGGDGGGGGGEELLVVRCGDEEGVVDAWEAGVDGVDDIGDGSVGAEGDGEGAGETEAGERGEEDVDCLGVEGGVCVLRGIVGCGMDGARDCRFGDRHDGVW